MDRRFLEFWGNFLISAGKGQKQLEDMARWIGQDFRGFEDITAMFRKFYGLDRVSESSANHEKTLEKAAKDFQKSFEEYLKLLGFVPLQEHLELLKKYEALKEKAAAQEETIKHLLMLLDEKGLVQGEMVRDFQDLVKKQAGQFQDLMKGFGQFIGKDSSAE